jgi:hypothetical protein
MRLGNRSPVGTPSEAIDRNFTVHDANTGMGQQKMVVHDANTGMDQQKMVVPLEIA